MVPEQTADEPSKVTQEVKKEQEQQQTSLMIPPRQKSTVSLDSIQESDLRMGPGEENEEDE